MKLYKKILAAALVLLLLISAVSCGDDAVGHAELVLPLSEDFVKTENESFDAVYENDDSMVGVIRISFEAGFSDGIPMTLMPDDFARYYMKKTATDAELHMSGDVPYYEYFVENAGRRVYQLLTFYRSKYAYFVVFFASDSEQFEEKRAEFLSVAENVYFDYENAR